MLIALPHLDWKGHTGRVEAVIDPLNAQRQALEQGMGNIDNPYKRRPIDVQDIEKPNKYDDNIANIYHVATSFSGIVEKHHPNWENVQCH